MFNNINENKGDLIYSSQMNSGKIINLSQMRSAYNKSSAGKNPYVDKTEISPSAMELFQRDLDINKFTQIALSDADDKSYLTRMKELFAQGVVDVYEDDVIPKLAENTRLINDIMD